MDKIRVLQYGMMNSGDIGGIDVFVMNLFRKMHPNRVEFSFLLYKDSPKLFFEDEISESGGIIYRELLKNRRKHPIKYYKNLYRFFKQVKNNIDVVHYNVGALVSIDVVIIAKLVGIKKIIVHGHSAGSDYAHGLRMVLHKINKHIVHFFANELIACSSEAAQYMFRKKDKVKIIHNAIDISKFMFDINKRNRYREEWDCKDDKLIGYIGRLTNEKNPLLLLNIFREIYSLDKSYKLIICGNGILIDKIKIFIRNNELDNAVKLLGNRNDVSEILSALDIACVPSFTEGFNISLIENQGNGIPCIVSPGVSDSVIVNSNVKKVQKLDDINEWIGLLIENVGKRISNEICEENLKRCGFEMERLIRDIYTIYKY